MAGPAEVTINDPNLVTTPDLGSNFYLKQAHVGKTSRAEASLNELKSLNNYVKVQVDNANVTTEFVDKYDVVVITDCYDKNLLVSLNNFCRNKTKAIGFIWTGALGLFTHTFVDYGNAHPIFDKDGEECRQAIIASITNDEVGLVTCHDEKRHGYVDGDWVTFREVKGMTQINGQKFQIKVVSPFTFTIGDTREFGTYISEGFAEQVKIPFQMEFKSLEAALQDPLAPGKRELEDPDMDFMRMTKPYELHLMLNSMLSYYANKGALPKLGSEEDAKEYTDLCQNLFEESKKNKMDQEGVPKIEKLDEALLKSTS